MSGNNGISSDKITVSNFAINAQDALSDCCCSDKYAILYFNHGSGKYIVEGIEHKVHEHTALVIKPFSYMLDDSNFGLSGIAIHFL